MALLSPYPSLRRIVMPYKDKEKQREYQRLWMAEQRFRYFQGKSCVDCGSTSNLELDHVEADKKTSHRIWSWSAERKEAELAKCVVRCADCHEVKTTAAKEKARGESSGTSKLTDEEVLKIRSLYAQGGQTKRGLARQFGVDEKNIRVILSGKAWQHLL